MGRRVFGEQVGLIGAWLSVLYPITVQHAQVVRTDRAAMFFVLLGLWLCLRLLDRPTMGNQIMAGIAVGLGIATRYHLAALIPLLLAVEEFVLWRQASRPLNLKAAWIGVHVGVFAVAIAFVLSTPFFFLDFRTAARDLMAEARSGHLGRDGLSPVGNFIWYLTYGIPQNITWPQMMFAAIGVGLAVGRRDLRQLLLLGFLLTFLAGVSLSRLHVGYWLIPLLPVFALFAADALNASISQLARRLRVGHTVQGGLMFTLLLLISVSPGYEAFRSDIRGTNPSTRILAREWILRNLPPGSRIAQEWYTAPLVVADFYGYAQDRYAGPLTGTDFVVFERFSLAAGRTLDDYYRDTFQYLVVSSGIYGRYLAEPHRYPSEVAFYRKLFAEGRLLQQFEESTTREGPVIRIYALRGL